MAIETNVVAVLKISGEKVFVLRNNEDGTVSVRRGTIAENGATQYNVETFYVDELASLPDFAELIVDEMIVKAKAQKRLYQAENKIDQQAEIEAAGSSSDPDPTPSIN